MSETPQELPSVLSLIRSRKKVFWSCFGLCVAGGIAYTLFAPAIWEAKATILFPVHTPSLLGVGDFEQQSLAASLTGGATPLKVYGGMLDSQRTLDYISAKTGLTKRRIDDMRSLQDQNMESSITISARDRDPDLAKRIVALHLEALDEVNREVSDPLSNSDAKVLAAKVEEQRAKVRKAEQNLLDFQNHAVTAPSLAPSLSATGLGIAKDSNFVPASGQWAQALKQLQLEHRKVDTTLNDIEARTHAIARSGGALPSNLPPVVKWRDKLVDLEYDLKMQELTLTPKAPEIVKLRDQIEVTRKQLESELGRYAKATTSGMVDPGGEEGERLPSLITRKVVLEAEIQAVGKMAKLAPGEGIELARLTRELGTASEILVQMQGQYELAKLQADRDPNRWQVLDEPEIDDKPVNKSFSKNGGLSALLGLALGCFAALVWPKRKAKPERQDLRQAA